MPDAVESLRNDHSGQSAEVEEPRAYINVPVPIVKEMEGYLDRRASAENSSVLSVLEDVLRKAIKQERQLVGNELYGDSPPVEVGSRGSPLAYASGRPRLDWKDVRTRLYVHVTEDESRALSGIAKRDRTSISEVAYGLALSAIRERRARILRT